MKLLGIAVAIAVGIGHTASEFAAQSVEGHIVNAGTGVDIPGVRIGLFQGGREVYSVTTDSGGKFLIEGVEAGVYTARYHARGFRDIPGFLDVGSPPKLQVTPAGEPVRLNARMQPLPKLSGRVLDAAGRPVPNATVWVLGNSAGCTEPKCFAALNQSKTGENGEYTVADVDDAGPLLVSAAAPSTWEPPKSDGRGQLGWTQTFYPGALDPQLSARLLAPLGGELSNLDIKLAAVPVHQIRGRALDAGGHAAPKVAITLRNGFGVSLDQVTKDDGTFEFETVAEGQWRLTARLDRDAVKLWTAQSVQIEDRDLENIELRLRSPFSIHGRSVFDRPDGVPLPEVDLPNVIALYSTGGFGGDTNYPGFPIGHPDANGDFAIQVYPGSFHIGVIESPPGAYYLDSVRFGNLDAFAGDISILSDAPPLTVRYKFGGGTVQGTIDSCGAGRVTLLPQEAALRRAEFVRETSCGANGQFEFTHVRPGEYYGFAVSADSSPRWYAAVLDGSLPKNARRVTVRANEHTSADIKLVQY